MKTPGEPVKFRDDAGCPDCGSILFNPGPRGGLAWNIRCMKCGSKFWYSPPFTPLRINNADLFYDLDLARTLSELNSNERIGRH